MLSQEEFELKALGIIEHVLVIGGLQEATNVLINCIADKEGGGDMIRR